MLLGRDLRPGEVLRTPFLVYAPNEPADWTLEIGLMQRGSGWFRDTGGTASLSYPLRLVAPGAPVSTETVGAAATALPQESP